MQRLRMALVVNTLDQDMAALRPTLMPLGDQALLVSFGEALSEEANMAAIAVGDALAADPPVGVTEIVPALVSVLLRYDPMVVEFDRLAGEVRVRLLLDIRKAVPEGKPWTIPIDYDGPDLADVAAALEVTIEDFVAQHRRSHLRVLATGFAPGFVYLGFHEPMLKLPRRAMVRRSVAAGSVLFAAGQTAIAATPIPTGWHLIGRTGFANFDAERAPPTLLAPGDRVSFSVGDA